MGSEGMKGWYKVKDTPRFSAALTGAEWFNDVLINHNAFFRKSKRFFRLYVRQTMAK